MVRKVVLVEVVVAVATGGAFAGISISSSFKPPCPKGTYSADGTTRGGWFPTICEIRKAR